MTDLISRRELIRSERAKQLLEDQSKAKMVYFKLLDPSNNENKFLETNLNGDYKTITKLDENGKYKTEEQKVIDDLKKLPSLKKLLKRARKKKVGYVRKDEKIKKLKLNKIYSHLKGKRYKENRLQRMKHSKRIDPIAELDWPVNMMRKKKITVRNNEKYLYSRFSYATQRRALSQTFGGEENSVSVYSGFTNILQSNRDRFSGLGRLTNTSIIHPKGDILKKSTSRLHKSVDEYRNRAKEVKFEKQRKQRRRFEVFLEKSKKNGKYVGAKLRVKKTSRALEKMKRKLATRLPLKKKKRMKKAKKKDILIITPYLSSNPAIRWNQGKGKVRSRSFR